jgi:hypothetical protein
VPPSKAKDLYDQLQRRDDPLGQLFRYRLATATRNELLDILSKKPSAVQDQGTATKAAGPVERAASVAKKAARAVQAAIGCAGKWETYRATALGVVGRAKPTEHRLRNMLITAHYAQLYLGNREFKWAGFAAYASKQVGCAMDHGQRIVRLAMAAGSHYPMKRSDEEALDSWDELGVSLGGYGAAELANYMYAKLGEGNQKLFLDIYPAHLFFIDHGYQRMAQCAKARKPALPSQLLEGFRLIEESRTSANASALLQESVAEMVWHEQLNVLQPIIYDDKKIRAILDLNELDVPGADPAKAILTSECTDPREQHTYYLNDTGRGDKKLYDPKGRMEWILDRVAPHYFALEGTARHVADMKALTRILYY